MVALFPVTPFTTVSPYYAGVRALPFSMEIAFVLFLGLVFGSFATALCWRVPREISWIGIKGDKDGRKSAARSLCPHCKNPLKAQDLIPFFSWVFLKGKCRHCSAAIDGRYPLIELFTALGCLGIYFVWGFTVPAFIIMAAVPLLVALFVIDLEYMILPNQLIFLAAALALIFIVYQALSNGFDAQILSKIAGMVVFALIVWGVGCIMGSILKKEALGMGDVKFFALSGLWLGLPYLPFFLIFSGLCGVALGLYYQFFLKKQVFPFGPALILSLYVCLLLQGLEIVPLIGVQ